ncbi:methyl-accepting chemotaxis protein [Oscillospiraceae bacterium MB08-C2-2]|nr:methyl-accepting chemotaxis protein [Oscillospiraceae bacterium MB08-C2-2]
MNRFKDLKMRTKLLLSFSTVALLTVIVGISAGISLYILNHEQEYMYTGPIQGIIYSSQMEALLYENRVAVREIIINIDNAEKIKGYTNTIRQSNTAYSDLLNQYSHLTVDKHGEEKQLLKDISTQFGQSYQPALEAIAVAAERGDVSGVNKSLAEVLPVAEKLFSSASDLSAYNLRYAQETFEEGSRTATFATVVTIALVLVAIAYAIVAGLYIANIVAAPTQELAEAARRIALGDVDVQLEVRSKDELGVLAEAFNEMAGAIQEQAGVLSVIATGDYTSSIQVRSEKDVVNRAISQMLDSNNKLISEIRGAAGQVSAGAQQVAQGAQELASGASQQAASVEEFSATLDSVRIQTADNASAAQKALELTRESEALMSNTIGSMNRVLESMQSIDESSKNITRIIKVIDDIAFQTNILALNAAVEAARAGQHGKGFAVVADEVRNLAAKSAAAAKETALLIEGSSQNVQEGNRIVERANSDLAAVTKTSAENQNWIRQIAAASESQNQAIVELNSGIDQIAQVVQANSAASEQSAAASEEMSAQAGVLNGVVERFRLRQDSVLYTSSESEIPNIFTGFAMSAGSDKY